MKLFHHITVFVINEQEKAALLKAGVKFSTVTRGPRGECASFEIGEDDPRWETVATIVASLEGNDLVPKKYRVQDLSMTKPTFKESATSSPRNSQIGNLLWLNGYSGQTVDELLALEGKYRIDSLVLAFEEAIGQKRSRDESQAISGNEHILLAVEALEREVNNGGYNQFFTNTSREFAPMIVESLERIGCKRTAAITQKAIRALGISGPLPDAIDTAMASGDKRLLAKLNRCNEEYYKSAEPIAESLFAFIKANKSDFSL